MCSISEEFKQEGMQQAKQEDVLELLEEIGTIPEMLEKQIREQCDMEVLKRWLKLAAKVETIEEFSTSI